MKYIMVTNWECHWDNLMGDRTLFTESMFKNEMSRNELKNGTKTLFIKRHRPTKKIEKSWEGEIYDFEDMLYRSSKAISFKVKLDREIKCPTKYLNYAEGWYCEKPVSGKKLAKKLERSHFDI